MKTILVFLCIAIPFCCAGVGRVTPEVEEEARRLWDSFCSNRDGGEDGDLHVYCKFSNDVETVRIPSEITVTPRSTQRNHVIFIRPPTKNVNHDVTVRGSSRSGQKTVIYVLPSKNRNSFNVRDQTVLLGSTEKPTVFFLKKDHGFGDDGRNIIRSPFGVRGKRGEADVPAELDAPAPSADGSEPVPVATETRDIFLRPKLRN